MSINVAIVGATGLVGQTMLKVLEERKITINKLYLYASSRSKGKKIKYLDKEYEIIELIDTNIANDIDIALFSAGANISKEYAPKFVEKGAVVIDNSSCFRMDKNIALVVPEVNKEKITTKGIIANPNCSTITVVPVLKVLDDMYKIKRIVYSTYQSVSGAGMKGLEDLENNLKGIESKKFTDKIAFNLIPFIDDFLDNNYTKEEMKMINETKKILNNDKIKITATCVRVPVRYSHSVSVNVEFEKDIKLDEVIEKLKNTEGMVYTDNPPMPLYIQGKDEVYVGRVRIDDSVKSGLNLWIVADNIRKGAATNAVQIAEEIIKRNEE